MTTQTPKTHVIFVIDRSGSMNSHWENVKNAFSKKILYWRNSKQDVKCSLIVFDDKIEILYSYLSVNDPCVDNISVFPRGNTALIDAANKAISIGRAFEIQGEDRAVLVNVFTDGYENASRVRTIVDTNVFTDKMWTVTFEGPVDISRMTMFGVPRGNILEWNTVEEGLKASNEAMVNYVSARSRGVTRTTSYYTVTTDLSTVTDISQFEDVTNQFKTYKVEKECRIDEFYKEKTGKEYVKGSCWYQLTKPERIQPIKAVLLMPKNSKTIYGGPNTRKTIGLVDDTKDAKVKPGNHSNWDVFVQSMMDNRKLVRGTTLLVRK